MTRLEAETAIIKKLREIEKIAKEYYPENEYLSMSITRGKINMNNAYWEHRPNGALDAFSASESEDIFSFPDWMLDVCEKSEEE